MAPCRCHCAVCSSAPQEMAQRQQQPQNQPKTPFNGAVARLPGAHHSWWEQEQIHRNKNPFPTHSLNAAGKKYHFLTGESICPGLHATENDYTAGEDTFPSKATSPAGCVGRRSWPHTVPGGSAAAPGITHGWPDLDRGTLSGSYSCFS